jgi:hypothetical protein
METGSVQLTIHDAKPRTVIAVHATNNRDFDLRVPFAQEELLKVKELLKVTSIISPFWLSVEGDSADGPRTTPSAPSAA